MAAGNALPGRCPGGAAPGLSALGKHARAGLVAEAAGSDRKGESPTAARHAPTACPGLNMAGGRGEPARRESRALAARAAAAVAVRPPILSPTSRRHLDRLGPVANSKTSRREHSRRLRRHPPLYGIRRPPRRTDGEDAAEDVSGFGAPAGRECDRRGPGGGRYHYRSSQGFGKAGIADRSGPRSCRPALPARSVVSVRAVRPAHRRTGKAIGRGPPPPAARVARPGTRPLRRCQVTTLGSDRPVCPAMSAMARAASRTGLSTSAGSRSCRSRS